MALLRWFMVVLFLSVALAGCIGAPDDGADDGGTDDLVVEGPVLGAESGLPRQPTGPASLEHPPEPVLGRWWDYEVDNLLLGSSFSVTTLVAGLDEDEVLIGLDAATFEDEAFVIHLPPVGEVKRDTLAFEAHDLWIMELEFPLTEGKQWTTKWYGGQDMKMDVDRVDGTKAEISVDHPNGASSLVYDAAVGAIVSFKVPDYAELELVDHGFGFQGDVQVPYGVDLVVCEGRLAGFADIEDCVEGTADAPVETVPIEGDYDRFSFGLIVFDLGEAPLGAGYFSIEVVAPDGAEYAFEKTPDQPGNAGAMFGHDDPAGDWEMTAVAGGVGVALFEGAAYRLLDVTLAPE